MLYLKGDADSSESFAVAVTDVGVHRRLAASGRESGLPAYDAGQRNWRQPNLNPGFGSSW